MVIEQMHFELKRRSQRNYTNFWKGMSSAEADSILNSAINDYVEMFCYGRNDKQYRIGFEVTQQRIDMLSTLFIGAPEQAALVPFTSANNIYEFKLDDLKYDYKHYVRAYVQVSECAPNMSVVIEQSGDLNAVLSDDNRKPSLTWRRLVGQIRKSSDSNGSSLYIYTNGEMTPIGLNLEYIKRPAEICLGTYNDIPTTDNPNPGIKSRVECDLPEDYHDLVVEIAVQIYGGIIENANKFQLAKARVVDVAS